MSIVLELVLASASIACVDPSGGRARTCEIEFEGPLTGAIIDAGAFGRTVVHGVLVAGETRKLVVPLPLARSSPSSNIEPRIDVTSDVARGSDAALEGSGRARFRGWRDPDVDALDHTSPALRARPLPPLEEQVIALPIATIPLACAAFVMTLALRRRRVLALCVALVASAAAFALVVHSGAQSRPAHLRLIEGDANESTWIEVEAARDELSIAGELDDLRIESRPADARLEWDVSLEPGEPRIVRARAVELYALRVRETPTTSLSLAANHLARFEETWVRREGSWTAHGAWPRDAPLPSAIAGTAAPGWLASGLPQGTSIVLGRLADAPGDAGHRTPTFVRISGL